MNFTLMSLSYNGLMNRIVLLCTLIETLEKWGIEPINSGLQIKLLKQSVECLNGITVKVVNYKCWCNWL